MNGGKSKHEEFRRQDKRRSIEQGSHAALQRQQQEFEKHVRRRVKINVLDLSFPSGFFLGRLKKNAKGRQFLFTFEDPIDVHKFYKRLVDTGALENLDELI